jgi:transcription-repair coupling factor (superfamily II helicase)
VFSLPGIEQAAENFWNDVRNRYEERRVDLSRPLLPPAELFLPVEDCFARLKHWPRVVASAGRRAGRAANASRHARCRTWPSKPRPTSRWRRCANFLDQFPGRVLFTAESPAPRSAAGAAGTPEAAPANRRQLAGLRRRQGTPGDHHRAAGRRPAAGRPGLALVAESPLFGQRVMQRRRRENAPRRQRCVIKNLTELREGAPVVHIDHGVGRYLGLATLEIDGQAAEFLTLEYAENAKLYVPVANLHLIARYTGSDDALAPLHRLGSEAWQKAKRKAAEQVRDVAAELLDIYARRAARKGYAFADPKADYATFSAGFPFEETPDQQAAIEAVRADMLAPSRWTAWSAATWASARPKWPCARRSSPCTAASRWRAGAHHPARPAALQQLPRPLRRLAGDRGSDEPLQVGQGSEGAVPTWPKARSTSSSAPTSCCRTT